MVLYAKSTTFCVYARLHSYIVCRVLYKGPHRKINRGLNAILYA